jgi:phosphopentomutase
VARRAFVVVLDAVGAGELPDAAAYGDAGAHTLRHVAQAVGGLDVPHLQALGLGLVDPPLLGVPAAEHPALHGRLHPLGPGKDSTTGHWELMGCVTPVPLPTYPDGFPAEVVAALEQATGQRFTGNRPADGMAILAQLGEHHLETGELILYTSADSVLQVAAHEDVLPTDALHAVCRRARDVMTGEHAVGRVIARPFRGTPGAFERTTRRKDFSVDPPRTTAVDVLAQRGVPVHCVGKTRDLLAGRSVAHAHPGATNEVALAQTTRLVGELDGPALVFTNLVETDQLYGHRKDTEGFHRALRTIDAAVGAWLDGLRDGDLLVLTADHGVDPTMPHHDHTREHVPLLATWNGAPAARHDGPMADVGQSVLRWLTGEPDPRLPGAPFVP